MTRLRFTPIDLSKLPPPDVVEELNFEAIQARIIADYKDRYPKAELNLASEPVIKLLDVMAYRELMMRQRINEAARAVLLGTAPESEIEYLGERFNVKRQIVTPANPDAIPPVAQVKEDIERYRARIQLSLEGYSTAGPRGAYVFHALAASPDVKDVAVDSPRFEWLTLTPEQKAVLPLGAVVLTCPHTAGLDKPLPGDVAISVLSATGNGTASDALNTLVLSKLSDEDIRPLSDRPRTLASTVQEYAVVAKLIVYRGPSPDSIEQAENKRLTEYVKAQHKLGLGSTLAGIIAALKVQGVHDVVLTTPTANIDVTLHQAAFCTAITLSTEVIDG